jgi:hypothetical protein
MHADLFTSAAVHLSASMVWLVVAAERAATADSGRLTHDANLAMVRVPSGFRTVALGCIPLSDVPRPLIREVRRRFLAGFDRFRRLNQGLQRILERARRREASQEGTARRRGVVLRGGTAGGVQ